MQITLEIKTGPRAGEIIPVAEGQTVTVGRGASATFPLPQDTFLSRVHFAIECNAAGRRLVDRQSANGTLLNDVKVGAPVELSEGDVILAGQTQFVVHLAASTPARPPSEPITDRPRPVEAQPIRQAPSEAFPQQFHQAAAVAPTAAGTAAIGQWFFAAIPDGWTVVEGFGLRRRERNMFPSEVMVSEAALPADQPPAQGFERYIESQLELLKFLVAQPQIQPGSPDDPSGIRGAEDAKAFLIRYKMDDGRRFLQRQVYIRSGFYAGALAMTTVENEAPAVQPFFDQILRGLAFRGMSGA